MEVKDSQIIKVLLESLIEQGAVPTPTTGGTTSQNLQYKQGVITKISPDVAKLRATIERTPSLKTSGQYINTRAELVDAIPSVIATFGKELQSNKISLGTILSDIKKGLVKAGYK